MDTNAPFLICGNARTGTTFLQLCLNSLHDVWSKYEMIFWRTKRPNLYHIFLPVDYPIRYFLETFRRNSPVVGSKFVFSGQKSLLDSKNIQAFVSQFEGLKIIFLKRSYFDILRSHTAEFSHIIDLPEPNDYEKFLRSQNEKNDHIENNRLNLKTSASIIFENFLSDVIINEICQRNDHLIVDYQNLGETLGEIARFIGSSASRHEISSILDHPPTVASKRGGEDLIDGAARVKRMCRDFDRKREEIIRSRKSIGDIFRFDAGAAHFRQ